MARQPEIAGNIQTAMIIAAALIEGVTFFALIIILLQGLFGIRGYARPRSSGPSVVPTRTCIPGCSVDRPALAVRVHEIARRPVDVDLSVRPERSSMSVKRNGHLSSGLMALCLAWSRPAAARCAHEGGRTPAATEHSRRDEEADDGQGRGRAGGSAAIEPGRAEAGLAIWTLSSSSAPVRALARFAWKPLLEALHSREQHLEHVLVETERARNESEALLAEHRKLMARAADEVRAILDKARQEAQATADQIIKQAQAEAELARQRAQRDIASARDQALAEIWEKTADMAVSVAGQVLTKELNDDRASPVARRRHQGAAGRDGANGHGGTAA